jgi:SAM-dependent methyltransferase
MSDLTTPVPTEDLVYLVSGHRDVEKFAWSRRQAVENVIIPHLKKSGIDFERFRAILDFGCGCGRILAGWEGLLPGNASLAGVDINPDAVSFCRRNITFAEVTACTYFPPLSFPDDNFDFIYAASVFTHLTLPAAVQWAGELARIAKSNAVLMVSYHGGYYANDLKALSIEGSRLLEERGYYIHLHGSAAETFAGSNNYASFFSSSFIRSLFKGFDLVRMFPGISHGPTPFAAYQDIAIFRRHAKQQV